MRAPRASAQWGETRDRINLDSAMGAVSTRDKSESCLAMMVAVAAFEVGGRCKTGFLEFPGDLRSTRAQGPVLFGHVSGWRKRKSRFPLGLFNTSTLNRQTDAKSYKQTSALLPDKF